MQVLFGLAFSVQVYNLSNPKMGRMMHNISYNRRFFAPALSVCLAFTLITLMSGCGSQPPAMSAENRQQFNFNVAESNAGYNVSAQQFFDFVSTNRYRLPGGEMTSAELSGILDSLLLDTLSGIASHDVKLEDHRLIYRDYLHQYQDILIKKFTDKQIVDLVSAYDSAEVLAFYRDNPGRFNAEEQVRLYQILISGYGLLVGPDSLHYKQFTTAQLRDQAREQIDAVYQLLKYGEAFENVASAFSQDAQSRASNGMVGWTTRGVYLDPFDSVAFRLKVGEFSLPYVDKDGWHIVYIDGHLPAGALPIDTPGVFELVRETLLNDKRMKRNATVIDSLRQGLQIQSNDAVMDSNIYRVNDETWCGIINGQDTVKAYVMKFYEEQARQRYGVDSTNRAIKLDILHVVADRYLTLQAVRKLGLDKDSDVVTSVNALRYFKTKQIVLGRQWDFDWVPSDSVISAYYQAHLNEYVFDKPNTIQTLTVSDSTFAAFVHDQAISGMDLSQIVDDFRSTSPGGVFEASPVMTVGEKDVSPQIWRASVLTPIGSISSLAKLDGNWVMVKVLARTESRNLALAKGEILVKLQKEHQQRVYEKFRQNMYKTYEVRFPKRLTGITLQPYWIRNKKS
jgi:hypothetical protein